MRTKKQMSFSKSYYQAVIGRQTIDFLPEVPVKYRGGDIVFKNGKHLPVDDFSKFIRRGDKLVPVICADLWGSEELVDLAPLLAVGVAELVVMCSFLTNQVDLQYKEWCCNLSFGKSWPDAMNIAKGCMDSFAETPMLVLSETMRGSIIDARFPSVRSIYRTLMALKLVNPQSFCQAILEAIRVTISLVPVFFMKPEEWNLEISWDENSKLAEWYQSLLSKKLCKFGAISYDQFGIRKITDCRGLGISVLCMFMLDLFKEHSVQSSSWLQKRLMSGTDMRETLEKMYKKCLGTDAVAEYMKTFRWCDLDSTVMSAIVARQAGFYPVDCRGVETVNLLPVGRGIVESLVLYEHATQSRRKGYKGYLPPLDCYYGSIRDIIRTFTDFSLSNNGIQYAETLKKENHERLLNEVLERVGIDKIRADAKKEAEKRFYSEYNQLRKEVSSLTRSLDNTKTSLEAAEASLVKKQDVITALREEVKALHIQLHTLTQVEDEDLAIVIADDTATIADMLDFVNQFKLIVIGDLRVIGQRLDKFGFTNFDVIQDLSNIDVTGDFFCVCTRFLSHSLVYAVESRHCDSLDQFFYFNGTNLEVLLKTYYAFLKRWVGDTN